MDIEYKDDVLEPVLPPIMCVQFTSLGLKANTFTTYSILVMPPEFLIQVKTFKILATATCSLLFQFISLYYYFIFLILSLRFLA